VAVKFSKRTLLRLYKKYIFDQPVKGIANWERYIPLFAKHIPETERQIIHKEYLDKVAI
jgi:hypothetical protein